MHCFFYYRQGCHLCEEMAAVIHQQWPVQFETLEWVDIDTDATLKKQFNELVPVLKVDDRIICQHFPDVERLAQCFGASTKQVS